MPEAIPANVPWQHDYIEQYRLDQEIINNYLITIWGNYKYFVEVNHTLVAAETFLPEGTGVSLTPYSAMANTSDSGCHASSIRCVIYAFNQGYAYSDLYTA